MMLNVVDIENVGYNGMVGWSREHKGCGGGSDEFGPNLSNPLNFNEAFQFELGVKLHSKFD